MNALSFFRSIALLMALLALTACGRDPAPVAASAKPTAAAEADHGDEGDEGDEGDGHGDEHEEEEAAGPIRMTADAMQAAGIRVATLAPAVLRESLKAPGEVVDNAYGTTLITPRIDALVVRRHAKLGDEVAKSAPLVTLSSVEVANAQGALAIAEQEWKRVQALGREAISGRRYSEAEIAVAQARATAQAYGLPAGYTGTANGEFTLHAPHAGRLTEDAFVVGERIEPGRTLFRLVDESVVWVDATLPSETAARIAVGASARVVLGPTTLNGKVLQRAHRTSEDTRNSRVRVEVENTNDALHGGDYVEVFLEAGEESAPQLSVPTAALLQIEGDNVVFRLGGDGTLVSVEVRAGAVVGDQTIVGDGLVAGDRIVVEGAYALKAMMLKAQLGEGHAH